MGKKEAAMDGTPRIIDLDAEVAKLRMFRRSPSSTAADRKGSVAQLASYRDGLLLALKSSGKDHWERHLTGDELIHILDGTVSLEIVCDNGPPKSFELRTGTVAVIPQGAWHRFLSLEGATQVAVTPFPGENIEFDVDDPREIEGKPAAAMAVPTIIDLNSELAKLTMFRGLTPQTQRAARKESTTRLAAYRDGLLLVAKSAGTSHWETHPEDELIHVLDGRKTLEIVCDEGRPKSFELRGGMMAVVPQGAWHRFLSAEGGTVLSATIPGEHIDLDISDPRTAERTPT